MSTDYQTRIKLGMYSADSNTISASDIIAIRCPIDSDRNILGISYIQSYNVGTTGNKSLVFLYDTEITDENVIIIRLQNTGTSSIIITIHVYYLYTD